MTKKDIKKDEAMLATLSFFRSLKDSKANDLMLKEVAKKVRRALSKEAKDLARSHKGQLLWVD